MQRNQENISKQNTGHYNRCKDRWRGFQFFSIEITSLGIVTSHFEDIIVLFKGTNINFQRMISKCMEVAMRASFYIYIRRKKEWTNPNIYLNFTNVDKYEHLTACFLSGLPCIYAGDKHLSCFYDYSTLHQFYIE